MVLYALELQADLGITNLEYVARLDFHVLDLLTVHERACGTALVRELNLPIHDANNAMNSRHARVIDLCIASVSAADLYRLPIFQ